MWTHLLVALHCSVLCKRPRAACGILALWNSRESSVNQAEVGGALLSSTIFGAATRDGTCIGVSSVRSAVRLEQEYEQQQPQQHLPPPGILDSGSERAVRRPMDEQEVFSHVVVTTLHVTLIVCSASKLFAKLRDLIADEEAGLSCRERILTTKRGPEN